MSPATARCRLWLGLWFGLLLAWPGLARLGGLDVRAAGVTVRYPAGWNLVSGPVGTVFNASQSLYSLGPGDAGYVASPGDAQAMGGRGYWAYFAADTFVSLNDVGATTATTLAPSGQWLLIGNPSGQQPATVSGADQVMAWDPFAGNYRAVTQLAAGQGAWAISLAGGGIIVSAPTTSQPIPNSTAPPFQSPAPTATPVPSPTSPLVAVVGLTCSVAALISPNISTMVVDIYVLFGAQGAAGAIVQGTVSAANGFTMQIGPLALPGGGVRQLINLARAAAGTQGQLHITATYLGQTTTADASCTFA